MIKVGVRSFYTTVAMSAGTNSYDIAVPANHVIKVLTFAVYNPDAANRGVYLYVTDAATGNQRNVQLYGSAALAATTYADKYFDFTNTARTAVLPFYAVNGQVFRFLWTGMTGSNNANITITYEVYRI